MKLRKEFFLTILSRISDVIVSRDLTDKIMMKYHLFKDSPEEEDRLIREEIDKYEQTGKRIYTKFLGKVADVSHVESLTDNIMKKYHLFKDSPEEEDKLIREEMDRYDAEMSTGTVDAFDDLIDTLELTEDDPEAQLKAKHSKSKKSRKSKRKVSKRKVSKRRKTKRKNKKTKRR